MTKTGRPDVPQNHLGYLDGLRAVAAIYVVLYHASLQIASFNHSAAIAPLLYPFALGHDAVGVFITLSGFCLALPIVRGDGTIRGGALNFFKRRAWRILPPYYLALLFSLAVIFLFAIDHKTGTHWDISVPVTKASLLTHLALLQDACNDPKINHAFWSISVEWRIYFLFPLLVLAWRRIGILPATILTVAAAYVAIITLSHLFGNSFYLHYVALFALGALAAAVAFSADRHMQSLRRLPWAANTVAMCGLLFVFHTVKFWHGQLAPTQFTDGCVGLGAMALLVTLAKNPDSLFGKIFSAKPLVLIGTFAYSIYLIHAPLIQVLWQYPFASLQQNATTMLAALVFLGTPLIVGTAYLFFLVCERPFLRSQKKESSNKLAREAIAKPAPGRSVSG